MKNTIIDATDLIVGRLATQVARKALEGENVVIINCEKAVITGSPDKIYERQYTRMHMGHHMRGPFFYRSPEAFVKRTIRGMLPYRVERGDAAMKRIICHVGTPKDAKDQKAESFKNAHISQSNAGSYTTVGEVCKLLGARS